MTAVSVTRSTFDLTISPSSMLESVPSYSSVIFAISSDEYSSCRSERTRERERRLRASTRAGFPYLPAFRTPVRLRVWTNGPGDDPRAPEHKQENLAGQARPRQRHDGLDLLLE